MASRFRYGPFSPDEKLAFRRMIEEEGVNRMDYLAQRKSEGATEVEANAIEKIEFLREKQREVLDKCQSLVESVHCRKSE